MIKTTILANWGLGLEVLKSLHRMPDVEIALVVTQYQKESSDPWFNAVYDFAVDQGYNAVVQESMSFDRLGELIMELSIDLLISQAFMRIFPKEIFSAPKYGSINIHPSLLPKYRGSSPTKWVIWNKEKVTGLTCHYIDEGIDTGDIIYQVEVPVESGDNIEAVIERQKMVVDQLSAESLLRITDCNFKPTPNAAHLRFDFSS